MASPWIEFVKGVQKKEGCSYKEALVKASSLWKGKTKGIDGDLTIGKDMNMDIGKGKGKKGGMY